MAHALHELKLVLPDRPQLNVGHAPAGHVHTHVWRCGCVARGTDEEALDVALCNTHEHLVAIHAGTKLRFCRG